MISFVVLNWNSGEYLRRCVASIEAQTSSNWELVLVDNGSTNESMAWVREWERQKVAKVVVYNRENLGYASGMNVGVARASGDVVVALNSDVFLAPNFVEEVARAAQNTAPDVGTLSVPVFVWGFSTATDDLTDEMFSAGVTFLRRLSVGEWHPAIEGPDQLFGPDGSTQILLRRAVDAAMKTSGHLYDDDYISYAEDIDLYLRLALLGFRCEPCYATRVWHIGSASTGASNYNTKPLWLQALSHANRIKTFQKLPTRSLQLKSFGWMIIDDLYRLAAVPNRLQLAREFAKSYWRAARNPLQRYPDGKLVFGGAIFSRTRYYKKKTGGLPPIA